MDCYCYLRNVQDLLADGKTPCERRSGEPFKGPIIPFGAMVEYHPISTKRSIQTSPIWGTCLGYALIAERISKGDILIADLEELEMIDASEVYPQGVNATEVLISQKGRRNHIPNTRL